MNKLTDILGLSWIRSVNVALLFVSVCLLIWIASIWFSHSANSEDNILVSKAKSHGNGNQVISIKPSSYDIIVEKDIFRELRKKFVAKPVQPVIVKTVQPPPEPPPKRPPPKLMLIGTVVLEDGNAAIIDYGGKPTYYKVGESIEEFVIQEIDMNNVLLDRAGEQLKISITPVR